MYFLQLFDDVTHSNSTYPVHNVWIVPGHVFVTVGNGHKLITFDCKPVIHQHVSILSLVVGDTSELFGLTDFLNVTDDCFCHRHNDIFLFVSTVLNHILAM